MNYKKLKEEPLKSAVYGDWFSDYKYTQLGNIDFVIAKHLTKGGSRSLFDSIDNDGLKSLLWAEAKQGTNHDIYESFVQLILTIGKERTFEKYLPPKYIGAFDAEKFAFIEYHQIQEIFFQNDFNWTVTPSNHDTKEFKQLYTLCKNSLEENSILFRYENQKEEFREFIRLNFKTDKDVSEKIAVTKNSFTFVFQKWSEKVKPSIAVDWEKSNKSGIIAADFFLADLLSKDGESLKDSLYVVLKNTKYELAKKLDEDGFLTTKSVGFTDKQKAYKEFWNVYERPPKEEYWDYIIARRDLLVPQDIRERKGSFFTPQIWVEKSQAYLAQVLGETWQDDYYIWDCCAGTGNLLNGLANYDRVWASTLDKQDVDVMTDRIANGWRMAENHVFQFDFLNDDFSKCPEELQEILHDAEKRKKLVIYINPPYAEAASTKTISGTSTNKTNVAVAQRIYQKYLDNIGIAGRELYAQFFIRIYIELNGCILGGFSTLKFLNSYNFIKYRETFRAKYLKGFICLSKTFDNVGGKFPIGFLIWDTKEKETIRETLLDVYEKSDEKIGTKRYSAQENFRSINDWIITTRNRIDEENIGYMSAKGSDFQNQNFNFIINDKKQLPHPRGTAVTTKNVLEISIYYAVRHCIAHTWLNHDDQFLYPNNGWKMDFEFQMDCLIYTLFHEKNNISSAQGVNHWIPFTREQVGCKKTFKSTFMSDFLKGGNLAECVNAFTGGLFREESVIARSEATKQSSDECAVKIASPTARNDGADYAHEGGADGATMHGGVAGVSPAEGVAQDASAAGARGRLSPLENLSSEAKAVYNSALELWKYYHAQPSAKPDASFYDIRRYFQGEKNGKMNSTSDDEIYNEKISDLREKMKTLAEKIQPKVYEYGFLKG